jgi:hypothetical protein
MNNTTPCSPFKAKFFYVGFEVLTAGSTVHNQRYEYFKCYITTYIPRS